MAQTIAVLITCHNRKAETVRCLQRLAAQVLRASVLLRVYLVDDGSTDGTAEAVLAAYPEVTLIRADGTLFWCNGMRLAWQHAAEASPDFYLWLNDDTLLRPGCIDKLLQVWERGVTTGDDSCIVVGSCCDPETGEHSYGGEVLSGGHPGRPRAVPAQSAQVQRCDTFNGNCVLVPRAAYEVLGMMRAFEHAISDTDYGLRAKRAGISRVVAPGYLAECRRNPPEKSWRCRALPRAERWKKLVSRHGLPPRDWWRFLWTHSGLRAVWYWPTPYVRVLMGL